MHDFAACGRANENGSRWYNGTFHWFFSSIDLFHLCFIIDFEWASHRLKYSAIYWYGAEHQTTKANLTKWTLGTECQVMSQLKQGIIR